MGLKQTYRENVLIIRIIFGIISWIGIGVRFYVTKDDTSENILEPVKFFTIQTNILVALWLTLAVIFKDYQPSMNEERMNQLYGVIRGGITSFITLTWLAYWALLSGDSDAKGLKLLSSNINHYIVPIYFIFDWALTEHKRYERRYIAYWMVYPLLYLTFAYIFQQATDDPIYDFFDISEHGNSGFVMQAIQLLIAFLIFCTIYFRLNQALVKEEPE
ncbi:MAG: Pr6Pr family membrane protein [Candidatus Kariarchaeaceae archaeon]|jgi:hypothetical protein